MARQPVPWWWIPASEHPGHLATKRGWEVMSAVERDALKQSLKNNGVFKLKDDKTGKELELAFVGTHQPGEATGRRPLLRLHRFSGRRHQGPNLRHRFLGQRQGRRDDRRSDQGAQKCRNFKSGQWIRCRATNGRTSAIRHSCREHRPVT